MARPPQLFRGSFAAQRPFIVTRFPTSPTLCDGSTKNETYRRTECMSEISPRRPAQACKIERAAYRKKGKNRRVAAYGITGKTPQMASAGQILRDNRRHWSIANSCHGILGWNFDGDRCRISKGYGPENITRLRRFAIGLPKSKGVSNVTRKMRQLSFFPRPVSDYLKITGKKHRSAAVLGWRKFTLPTGKTLSSCQLELTLFQLNGFKASMVAETT
jgi:predicted transposase YbfD/YdcC